MKFKHQQGAPDQDSGTRSPQDPICHVFGHSSDLRCPPGFYSILSPLSTHKSRIRMMTCLSPQSNHLVSYWRDNRALGAPKVYRTIGCYLLLLLLTTSLCPVLQLLLAIFYSYTPHSDSRTRVNTHVHKRRRLLSIEPQPSLCQTEVSTLTPSFQYCSH